MEFFCDTNIGKTRKTNQDAFRAGLLPCGALLAVVCDGMGGKAGGQIASKLAVDAFYESLALRNPNDDILVSLRDGVNAANEAVLTRAADEPSLRGMGTTLVAALFADDKLYAVNVGDSRLYHITNDSIKQLTKDHSYVQYLVDMGRMTGEEAKKSTHKNIITRAVGIESILESDTFVSDFTSGYVLLCSDGLTNYVDNSEISECILNAGSLSDAVTELIDKANSRGGGDNITAALIAY